MSYREERNSTRKLPPQAQRERRQLGHEMLQLHQQQRHKWSSLAGPYRSWSILAPTMLDGTCGNRLARAKRRCKPPCVPLALLFPPQILQTLLEWNRKSFDSNLEKKTSNTRKGKVKERTGWNSPMILVSTLTKRVLGARIEWASTPLRYAFTSGIPEPAAAGAT